MKNFPKKNKPIISFSQSQNHLHQLRYSKYLKQLHLLFPNKLPEHLISIEAEYL